MRCIYKSARLFLLAAMTVMAVGCYKDKGNYDYVNDGKSLVIDKGLQKTKVFQMDEQISVEATIDILYPDVKESDLSYEWQINGEVVSNDRVMEIENPGTGEHYGLFCVKDNKNNLEYSEYFCVEVLAAYNAGWAIVTENGSTSDFSYLTIDPNSELGSPVFLPIEKNVYSNVFGGKKLSAGVTEVSYHFYDAFGQTFALNIVQGGEDGPVELNASDMSVYGFTKNDFLGGGIPNGEVIKKMVYKQEPCNVYALTESGNVYVRDEEVISAGWMSDIVPHAGKFATQPIYVDGYDIKITDWIDNSFFSTWAGTEIAQTVAYNQAEEQFVAFYDAQILPFNALLYTNGAGEPHMPGDPVVGLEPLTYPGPEDMSDYEVVTMKGCGIESGMMESYVPVGTILKNKANGNYYLYSFRYFMSDVDIDNFVAMPDGVTVDPETMVSFGNFGGRVPLLFFTAEGNKDVYYFNTITGVCRKIYTSTSPVTALGFGEAGNGMAMAGYGSPTIYADMFVIGTEDGVATIVDLSDAALASGNATVIHTENIGEGKITAIEYMSTDANSF